MLLNLKQRKNENRLKLKISCTKFYNIVSTFQKHTNSEVQKPTDSLLVVFFAAVNHLSRRLRKNNFTDKRVQNVMICDLFLVDLDPFCVFVCFMVCCL